jgi:hypothetical protein
MFGIDDILGAGLKILEKVIPDPAARQAAEIELFKLKQAGEFKELDVQIAEIQSQTDTNKEEAKSTSMFVAGWRPWIGWTCGSALFLQYILRPIVQWFAVLTGHPIPELPGIDDQLWQLLTGMLGLGTLRTYEKIKGKA